MSPSIIPPSSFAQSTRSYARRYAFAILAAGAAAAGLAVFAGGRATPEANMQAAQIAAEPTKVQPQNNDPIQIALLLDTSSSMSGLIDQARSQLWKIVNELGQGRRTVNGNVHGVELEIALYEYGKETLPSTSGFIRQVVPFTKDLDQVSEALYALETNGGDEFCGRVIQQATNELQWSTDKDVLKFIFIAGNEDFDQGAIAPKTAIADAIVKGIDVQLIHCGSGDETWQRGASLARSTLINIDQNSVAVQTASPYDDEIEKLSEQLNATYVAYGAHGGQAMQRQKAQDSNAKMSGKSSSVSRAAVKAKKSNYNASSWDLVDATDKDMSKVADLKDEELPAEFHGKSTQEKQAILNVKRDERSKISSQIQGLTAQRAKFVEAERAKHKTATDNSFDEAALQSVKKAAISKGYRY
jgi:hypothetical protein